MKLFHILFISTLFGIQGQTSIDKINEIEKYLSFSQEFSQTDTDSLLLYSNKALRLSKAIENDTLIAKSHLQRSNFLLLKKEFKEADSLLQDNLKREIPKHLEGQTWHALGEIQFHKSDYKKALVIFLKAAKILEGSKDQKSIATTYRSIGAINARLGYLDKALPYFEKALPLSGSNESLRLRILVNLSTLYCDQKQYDKYLKSVNIAENLAKKSNAKRMLAVIYSNLSNYYASEGKEYDKAILYGKNSIKFKKEINSLHTLYFSYNNLGYSYLKKKEYRKAIPYLDSALNDSKGVLKSYVYNNLKDAYVGLQDYKTAIKYADLEDAVKDTVANAQQKEKVAEITEKFESEKKQQQINILDAQNQIQALTISQQKYVLIVVAVFAILFLIIGYAIFKNYKTKQQIDTLILKQKLRKTQLNPHFLFNALQSIQNFIHKNDKEKSSSYLNSYSKLIRLILEKSDENFSTVADDKLALTSYLNLQQLTHNSTFDYKIEVATNIDEDFDRLPSLITQPFVENAVLHGLKNIENGLVTIKYYKDKNQNLNISIQDNGKGFKTKKQDANRLHKSMSVGIIKEQLKNLSKTLKGFSGDVAIISSSKGTEIQLQFTNS